MAGAVGVALLAVFYIPFVLHPHFSATYTYLVDRRIGGSFPYNNLADFALRTTIYNTSYQFGLVLLLTLAALTLAYRRGLGRVWGTVVGVGLIGFMAMTVWRAEWLRFGETDYLFAPILLAIVVIWILPKISVEERMLWLWFAPPFFLSLYLLRDPNSHFYIFYTPWMLLAGLAFANAWRWLERRIGTGVVAVGVAGAAALIALFAFYAVNIFIRHDVEVVRNWETQDVMPAWLVSTPTTGNPIFGVPHRSGWKAVGALFDDGLVSGSYAANVRQWIGDWYTRGGVYCEDAPEIVILELLEREEEQAELVEAMGGDYGLAAVVQVDGEPRIHLYQRGMVDHPVTISADEYSARFDRTMADADFPILLPDVAPQTTGLNIRFGESLALAGYRLAESEVARGQALDLVLVWQVIAPVSTDYTLFAQILGPEARKFGQLDTTLDCNSKPTSDWQVGDRVVGHYRIPVFQNGESGVYPLWIGLYDNLVRERLHIVDGDGNDVGDAVKLASITVTEERGHASDD
ncbi:MAG: hypothetical protein HC802_04290 [Caldilineaceae bacterium]|nr:hypothetical protein [Caldilineaceae bacterium]